MSGRGASARRRAGARLVQAGFVISLALVWYVLADRGLVSPFVLPHPADVGARLADILGSGAFLGDLRVTFTEVATAFAASTIGGLALGYLISRSAFLVRVVEPLLSSIYAVPVILFLPLFLLMFGLGIGSKVAMGITTSFFPIVLSTIAGFANVERVYLAAARAMGASDLQLVRYVLLPAALPVIVTGLRIGFIVAFLSILGAEAIASYAGLGHQIVAQAENLEIGSMFAYIAIVVATAALLNMLLTRAEQRSQWQ